MVPRSKAQVDRDVAAIERGSEKLMRLSKEELKAWFVKHGFLTKGGKWTKRYGG